MRRWLFVSLLAAATLPAALPVSADGAVGKRVRMTVPLPPPGNVALTTFQGKATPRARRRLRAGVTMARARREALAPSVRLLWATRVVRRRRKATVVAMVMVINKAEPRARAAQACPVGQTCTQTAEVEGVWIQSTRPLEATKQTAVASLANVPQSVQEEFGGFFTSWWKDEDEDEDESVFGESDPNLDTGHYDDGHAFGWNPRGQTQAWANLTEFTNGQLDQVVQEIEAALNVDVDGDGDKGSGQVDTVVSGPTITGGEQQP